PVNSRPRRAGQPFAAERVAPAAVRKRRPTLAGFRAGRRHVALVKRIDVCAAETPATAGALPTARIAPSSRGGLKNHSKVVTKKDRVYAGCGGAPPAQERIRTAPRAAARDFRPLRSCSNLSIHKAGSGDPG